MLNGKDIVKHRETILVCVDHSNDIDCVRRPQHNINNLSVALDRHYRHCDHVCRHANDLC